MLIRSSAFLSALTLGAALTLGTVLTGVAFPTSAATRFAAPPPPGHCDATSCTASGTQPGDDAAPDPAGGGGGVIGPDPCAGDPLCGSGGITGPAAPAVSTADVVQVAMDSMSRPRPQLHTSPRTRTYVGLRTFLWVDRAQWRTQTATASVDGQTVSARSVPTAVEWNLGEKIITCTGRGTPYNPDGPMDQPGSCTYTYQRSSAGQPGRKYQISATIKWRVSWTCTGACDTAGGDLGLLSSTTVAQLPVGEIQTGSQAG